MGLLLSFFYLYLCTEYYELQHHLVQLRGYGMRYCNANGGNTQPIWWVFVGTGTINRTPTAADGLPFCGCLRISKYQKTVLTRTLATRYNTTTYTKCLLLHCKNHTFAM